MNAFKYLLPVWIVVLLTCTNLSAFGQTDKIYTKALAHIKLCYPNQRIRISDTIIHLDFESFSDKLGHEWKQDPQKLFAYLHQIDTSQDKYSAVYKNLDKLNTINIQPNKLVYFSNIYQHMMIAEVIKSVRGGPWNHQNQASFNEADQYLFLFDKKNNIKRVFYIAIAYD